jgi:hypothetical protein
MMRSPILAALGLSLFLDVGSVLAGPVDKGHPFPLSDGATPKTISVEVQHIMSDNTIDMAVSLVPPDPLPRSDAEFFMQVGEFCLRYQAEIIAAALPAAVDRERMNVFVPLYRLPIPGKSNQFNEAGFAFRIIEGKCSLEAPFPSSLISATQKRATQPIGSGN